MWWPKNKTSGSVCMHLQKHSKHTQRKLTTEHENTFINLGNKDYGKHLLEEVIITENLWYIINDYVEFL